MRRGAFIFGVLLIVVAIVAFPSGMVVSSYASGSASHGRVVDGRYFVNPQHGQPVVEVSKTMWWTVYWSEKFWPFSALIPGWVGMFLMSYGKGPNQEPTPPPPAEFPRWMVWMCGAAGVFVVFATLLFWAAVRIPWATMVAAWVLLCVTVGFIVWVHARSVKGITKAEPPTSTNQNSNT